MRNISANFSKEQKLHRSLVKVQGLLFQIKKLLTVQNNCGFFFVWFLLVLILLLSLYYERVQCSNTCIVFAGVPHFLWICNIRFFKAQMKVRSQSHTKNNNNYFITNAVLPEACVRDG